MLVIERLMSRARRRAYDDSGAVLVTIVVVMFVGFIIAATIAASVMFTIGANDENKDRTEAFIAAESGRDAQLAKIMSTTDPCAPTPASLSADNDDPTDPPRYAATASGCFDPDDDSVVRIVSTGTAPDGSTSTITSDFSRLILPTFVPGGTMSYFAGTYLATQSTYTGDLVIRDSPITNGNFACNSTSTINGDLWVPVGFAALSANCTINGSIFVRDYVNETNGSESKVSGDVRAGGTITLTSNKSLVGGSVFSNADVVIDKAKVAGNVVATGSVTVNGTTYQPVIVNGQPVEQTYPAVGGVTGTITVGKKDAAIFNPSLQSVYEMTTWVDLPLSRSAWSADGSGGVNVDWHSGPCNGANVSGILTSALPAGMTRTGIDYTGCSGPVTIDIDGGNVALDRDVVFLVRAGSEMTIDIDATLTSPLTPASQMFFIRGDANNTNSIPDCGTSMGSDGLEQKTSTDVRMMFYSPCGLGRNNQNGLQFNGQFYSNSDGSTHLVQPDFTCQEMTWAPMLDMGCRISTAVSNPGTSIPLPQPPELIWQSE